MSRVLQIGAIALFTICGVATSYATFQPEFEKLKEAREKPSKFAQEHSVRRQEEDATTDNALSQAIMDDFKEAGQILKKGEFGWGFRNLVAGRRWDEGTGRAEGIGKGEGEIKAKEG